MDWGTVIVSRDPEILIGDLVFYWDPRAGKEPDRLPGRAKESS
jgi:hypothetical protein